MSGIQPHSKPVPKGDWVIFAANAYSPDYVEEVLTSLHVPYKRLQGRYNGVDEFSFIVHHTDWEHLPVQALAKGEHAIMLLSDRDPSACMQRKAWIVTLEENPVTSFAGWFQEVTKQNAMSQGAYTFDPDDHRYWVVQTEKPVPVKRKVNRIGPLFYDFDAPHAAGRYPKAVA